jgi:hypothetical protein
VDLCNCHGGPLSWCPTYRDRNVTTVDGPDVGVVHQADYPSECGVCGGPIATGEQVVRLPAPTWSRDLAHAVC